MIMVGELQHLLLCKLVTN